MCVAVSQWQRQELFGWFMVCNDFPLRAGDRAKHKENSLLLESSEEIHASIRLHTGDLPVQ